MTQQSSEDIPGKVVVTDGLEHESQQSVRIATPTATWYYHKSGAGFASLEDADGNDWIGHHPGNRAAGEFRGIPNLVHPEGYFHPGGTDCETTIVQAGPDKAVLESQAAGGAWAVRWEVTAAFARLTVLKAAKQYWFLYEGTPGGEMDEAGDTCVLSDGLTHPLSARWETRLAPPRWVYFRDAKTGRILYFIHHTDDGEADSFWPMNESPGREPESGMTVFGFGRIKLVSSLAQSPATFTVGLAEARDDDQAKQIIQTVLGLSG